MASVVTNSFPITFAKYKIIKLAIYTQAFTFSFPFMLQLSSFVSGIEIHSFVTLLKLLGVLRALQSALTSAK